MCYSNSVNEEKEEPVPLKLYCDHQTLIFPSWTCIDVSQDQTLVHPLPSCHVATGHSRRVSFIRIAEGGIWQCSQVICVVNILLALFLLCAN